VAGPRAALTPTLTLTQTLTLTLTRYDYLWQGLERPSDAACAPYFRKNLGASESFTEGERKECATLLAAWLGLGLGLGLGSNP